MLLHFQDNCHICSRKLAQRVGIPQGSVFKVMKLHRYHPLKIKQGQKLAGDYFDRRVEFCNEVMQRYNKNNWLFSGLASRMQLLLS